MNHQTADQSLDHTPKSQTPVNFLPKREEGDMDFSKAVLINPKYWTKWAVGQRNQGN